MAMAPQNGSVCYFVLLKYSLQFSVIRDTCAVVTKYCHSRSFDVAQKHCGQSGGERFSACQHYTANLSMLCQISMDNFIA